MKYIVPTDIQEIPFPFLNLRTSDKCPTLYGAGNLDLLKKKTISVIGSRKVSNDGILRAEAIASTLVEKGIVVMSGLAYGVDTYAMRKALKDGGSCIGVIATPMDRVYPQSNTGLQTLCYTKHLLISPFAIGTKTLKRHFPHRNKIMALLSDATVIVEASEASGTKHQAAECIRLGRPLYIHNSCESLIWVQKIKEHVAFFSLTQP